MKIVTVIGARPQFIKAAMVSRAIDQNPALEEVIVHTGQHFDNNMSHLFFQEMGIREPKYNLDIHSLPHGALTGRMMEQIEHILMEEKPDAVLVYGDTDSTLAGALAAKKLHIRLFHVEAGLRSFNMAMPEEINRILTDRISDILFCPTDIAVANLISEGIDKTTASIVRSGDVMKDAALHFASMAKAPANFPDELCQNFALCTLHRAENTDNREILEQILRGLELSCQIVPVVIPLHPRTRKILEEMGYSITNTPIHFIEPVGYLEMLYLLQHCKLVLTDSGGLQKEAYFFHKYCITLRKETEWIELAGRGYNHVIGHQSLDIVQTVQNLIDMPPIFSDDLYGNGAAAFDIISSINQDINSVK